MVHSTFQQDWSQFNPYILQLEQEGLVTRTFRRLDPTRQQEVLHAILSEAAEKGPAALNIKEVARRANVSVGSLYTYFPNRDGMLDFAVQLCVRYVIDTFNTFRPYLAALPLREALAAYLTGGIEWSQTQAGLIGFFARAAYHGDPQLADHLVRPIAETMRLMISDILSQASARGELREEIDLEAAIRIVHVVTITLGDSLLLPYLNVYYQITDEQMTAERVLETLLALLIKPAQKNNHSGTKIGR